MASFNLHKLLAYRTETRGLPRLTQPTLAKDTFVRPLDSKALSSLPYCSSYLADMVLSSSQDEGPGGTAAKESCSVAL